MALPDRDVALAWLGKTVVDRDGAKIGRCSAVFTDDATGVPEWLGAQLGRVMVFVPLLDAGEVAGHVQVVVSRDQVVHATVGRQRGACLREPRGGALPALRNRAFPGRLCQSATRWRSATPACPRRREGRPPARGGGGRARRRRGDPRCRACVASAAESLVTCTSLLSGLGQCGHGHAVLVLAARGHDVVKQNSVVPARLDTGHGFVGGGTSDEGGAWLRPTGGPLRRERARVAFRLARGWSQRTTARCSSSSIPWDE